MTLFDIAYDDFKREDTTNTIVITLYTDDRQPITPNASHTWKAKVSKGDKHVGEYPVTISDNTIKLSSSNLTRLPNGDYGLELWETYDGSTTIYPSAGVMEFRVHRNANDTLGTIDPTTDINAIIDDLHKAGQNIKVVATNTLSPGSKASVTQSINNGENQLTFNIPQGEKGEKGDKGEKGEKGDEGEQGNVGPAPTLKVGTVTKLNPDQAPTVALTGGNGTYTLNMGIPQGDKGKQGIQGPTGTNIIKYDGDIPGYGNSGETATFARSNLQPSDIAKVGDIVFDQYPNDKGIEIGFWRITSLSSTSCTVAGLSNGFTIPKGETDETATNALNLAGSVNNKVAEIQSNGGGRNLLQGTGTASGDVANGDGIFTQGAFNGYDAVKTNTAWHGRFINLKSALGRTNAKAGDWYTISVYIKADKQINTGQLNAYRAHGSDVDTNDDYLEPIIYMSNRPITTQWQQYAWSFQINDVSLQRQNTRVEYGNDTGDNWIYWAGWMLEKGMVAHDWQPAPEDAPSNDSQLVHKTNNETIAGDKTFVGNTTLTTTTILEGNYGLRVTSSGIQKTTDGKTWVPANI